MGWEFDLGHSKPGMGWEFDLGLFTNDYSAKENHDCIMFTAYILIYIEYRYIQNIAKNYTKY